MNNPLQQTMLDAMRLMQSGDLNAATRAIQEGLQSVGEPPTATPGSNRPPNVDRPWIDAVFTRMPNAVSEPAAPAHGDGRREPDIGREGFEEHRFTCDAGSLGYKLFVPAGIASEHPPLLLMLHGCTQSADDFARGTRMNVLAQKHGYVVAYPMQVPTQNPGRCWNWFRSQDQQRGAGEAALIAALTRDLVSRLHLDERRVYVAGLSAGGAMAAVLASTYPDVYAGFGVHSGLPYGAAHDLPSGLAAMRHGAPDVPALMEPVPAIVFHGDRDATVDPCNGAAVIAQSSGTPAAVDQPSFGHGHATTEHGSVPGGRAYTRTIFRTLEGAVTAEHWVVHGAGHAWFGGDPTGSYTDPSGPDASAHMLRFFDGCVRGAIN